MPSCPPLSLCQPPRSARLRRLTACGLLCAFIVASPVQAQTAAPPSHFVGDDALPMAPGGLSAWLDEADREVVLAALLDRYPMPQRDGLAPQALLLWRHPDGDWRYAALIADQRRPGATCVAASFSASTISPTAALLRKYFFVGGDRS